MILGDVVTIADSTTRRSGRVVLMCTEIAMEDRHVFALVGLTLASVFLLSAG